MVRPKETTNTLCVECGKSFYRSKSLIDRNQYSYCSRVCSINNKRKGFISSYGYKAYRLNGKIVKKHREIMETHLKRRLLSNEIVHHVNGNKLDNRIENLEVCSKREHFFKHNPKEVIYE